MVFLVVTRADQLERGAYHCRSSDLSTLITVAIDKERSFWLAYLLPLL
jgi:hypothetical protein